MDCADEASWRDMEDCRCVKLYRWMWLFWTWCERKILWRRYGVKRNQNTVVGRWCQGVNMFGEDSRRWNVPEISLGNSHEKLPSQRWLLTNQWIECLCFLLCHHIVTIKLFTCQWRWCAKVEMCTWRYHEWGISKACQTWAKVQN